MLEAMVVPLEWAACLKVLFLSHRKACLERQARVRGSNGPPDSWFDLQGSQALFSWRASRWVLWGMLLVRRREKHLRMTLLKLCLPSHLQLIASP